MKAELLRLKSRAGERVIVVLTREKISWYRVGENQSVAEAFLTQPISQALIEIPESLLPEDGLSHTVELLADTDLDDLDRVQIVGNMPWYLRYLKIHRTLWELKREYSNSDVFKLPKEYYPNIASVLHSSLPNSYLTTIENLHRNGLVISHLTTSTQLLRLTNRLLGPCLYCMPSGGHQKRHILFHGAAVVFMRITGKASDEEIDSPDDLPETVQATLSYVTEAEILKSDNVRIVTPMLHCEDTSESLSYENYLTHTYVSAVAKVVGKGANSDVLVTNEAACNAGSMHNPASVQNGLIRSLIFRWDSRVRKRKSSNLWNRYKVNGKLLKHYDFLEPSRVLLRSHSRLILLRNVTIILAIFTLLAVLLASVHGVRQIRALNAMNIERNEIESEIEQLLVGLDALHEKPFLAAETLKRNQDFSENLKATPVSVLTLIANYIKEFPSLAIESLSWSVLPDNGDSETVVSSVANSAARVTFIPDSVSGEKLVITLSGFMTTANTLRDKQSQLDALTLHLSQDSSVSNLLVLASPVDSARRSDNLVENDGIFKVQFVANIP